MNIKLSIKTAALIIALTLLVAACVPETAPQPPATPTETPSPPVAAEVPEITQAEQTVQEIGAEDIDEIDKDLDTLVLP